MWISRYVLLFALYSLLGWIYESLYCVVSTGKWENRGFLFGPVIPIYGVGAVAVTAIAEHFPGAAGVQDISWWKIFLISFFGSIVLEYGTSWLLEKMFHALWWDYRNIPLNINGRVCFPASFFFGIAGLMVVYMLYPVMQKITGAIHPLMTEFLALVIMGILGADLALTVSVLTAFTRKLQSMEKGFNEHMEYFVETIHGVTFGTKMKLTEEGERIYLQRLEKAVDEMSHTYRAALSRVKRFVSLKGGRDSEAPTGRVVGMLLQYLKRSGDKKEQ